MRKLTVSVGELQVGDLIIEECLMGVWRHTPTLKVVELGRRVRVVDTGVYGSDVSCAFDWHPVTTKWLSFKVWRQDLSFKAWRQDQRVSNIHEAHKELGEIIGDWRQEGRPISSGWFGFYFVPVADPVRPSPKDCLERLVAMTKVVVLAWAKRLSEMSDWERRVAMLEPYDEPVAPRVFPKWEQPTTDRSTRNFSAENSENEHTFFELLEITK